MAAPKGRKKHRTRRGLLLKGDEMIAQFTAMVSQTEQRKGTEE
jgi:hypothetical protein